MKRIELSELYKKYGDVNYCHREIKGYEYKGGELFDWKSLIWERLVDKDG